MCFRKCLKFRKFYIILVYSYYSALLLNSAVTQTHTPTDLIAGPAFEAVGVELVDMENMNGAFDAEVMQLAGHFKE